MTSKLLVIASVLLVISGRMALADTFEYVYQGNPINVFLPGSEPSQFTSANAARLTLITNTVLSPDTTYELGNNYLPPTGALLSWTFSDGTNAFNSSDPRTFLTSSVTTDSMGQIAAWGFTLGQDQTSAVLGEVVNSCGAPYPCLYTFGVPEAYAGDVMTIYPLDASFLYAGVANTPGSWTGQDLGTGVAEPGALSSLGICLLEVAIRRFRTVTSYGVHLK
jgi:hypothetical protein